MKEKPYQKPADDTVPKFEGHEAHVMSGADTSSRTARDLARFAGVVVALNARITESRSSLQCQVAPLENMQRGLKIKRKTAEDASVITPAMALNRFRKE